MLYDEYGSSRLPYPRNYAYCHTELRTRDTDSALVSPWIWRFRVSYPRKYVHVLCKITNPRFSRMFHHGYGSSRISNPRKCVLNLKNKITNPTFWVSMWFLMNMAAPRFHIPQHTCHFVSQNYKSDILFWFRMCFTVHIVAPRFHIQEDTFPVPSKIANPRFWHFILTQYLFYDMAALGFNVL